MVTRYDSYSFFQVPLKLHFVVLIQKFHLEASFSTKIVNKTKSIFLGGVEISYNNVVIIVYLYQKFNKQIKLNLKK